MPRGSWLREKSRLYQEAKRLALLLNIQPLSWRSSTSTQLRRFLRVNQSQERFNIRQTQIQQVQRRERVQRRQRRRLPISLARNIRRGRNIPLGIFEIKFRNNTDEENFGNRLKTLMNDTNNYYISILDDEGNVIRLRRSEILNKHSTWNKFYNLYHILFRILENNDDYGISTNYIRIQLHKEININPPLRNQRQGIINCACKVVLEKLATLKQTPQVKRRIARTKEVNEKYFTTGINDTGLQLLANKARLILIIEDKLKRVWREFHPQSKGDFTKLLLVSHNNHIENICDSDDEEEEETDFKGLDPDMPPNYGFYKNSHSKGQTEFWFDTNEAVIEFANDYEATGKEGTAILSKGNLVAYITDNDIYKTKFHQHEIYPECFTSGGVGKAKFIQQHPEFKYGINDEDPFYQLLIDADKSGFYFKNGEGKVKYDQNQAYKSFKTSGIFQGFPNLEAIFEVNSSFSDFISNTAKHGLLYIEYDTLTLEVLRTSNPLIYEGSGWYPIEIVKANYEKYGINPLVKQYAYASETFDVDFTDYTNDQFRTFLGKCISNSYDDVWKTTSYDEFMRARYILKDRIVKISQTNNVFEIVFTSDQKPWNMPVISAYVKAHQKFNIFNQYNHIISAGNHVNAISVDSIEVSEKCDELFNLGKELGQWKLQEINKTKGEPFVIEREEVKPTMTGLPFKQEYLLPKYLHYSGAGGNGKTETIINLAKAYKKAMFIAPTTSAVKNLLDRAKQLGVEIQADTYHRVFGFGCEDRFPRNKYNKFILDECSMVSAPVLKQMMEKVSSIILSGDFYQLPCVNEQSIYDNWTNKKSKEYEKFEVRQLTKNWRQKTDPEFFNLCNRLRGRLTKKEAMKLLEILNSRVLPLPSNDTLDDIYICGINSQVDSINNKHKIKVGCKVICNIKCYDLEKRMIPNGSIGIITEMRPFKVQWEETISTFKGIGKNNSGKSRFNIAYALTVHKCQGRTLKITCMSLYRVLPNLRISILQKK
jgi:hypothetical protein